jgi:hypothetical protein
MKEIFFIILMIIFLSSCQSDEEVKMEETEITGVFANLTDKNLLIALGTRHVSSAEFIELKGNEIYSTKQDGIYSGPTFFGLSFYDSIEAFFYEEDYLSMDYKVIRFYPDSSTLPSGKNLYDSTDWIIQNDSLLFQFTEEDYKNALEN